MSNPKHEQFAQALVVNPTQKDAFLTAFPGVAETTARSNSSRLLANASIKERFYEILRERQADLPQIGNRFARWLNADDAPAQSWDAVKTGLKIYGILDESDQKNMQNVQVSIIRISANKAEETTQVITTT